MRCGTIVDMQNPGRPKALLSWSSGKDSAYALSILRESDAVEVVALVTTIDQRSRRVPVHFVRESILDRQSEAVGLPLWKIELDWPCSNVMYQAALQDIADRAVRAGISHMAFGDLFLRDIRAYREQAVRDVGLEPIFPLWGRETADLATDMIAVGLKATITCVDRTQLDPSFAGAAFDTRFLAQLPPEVDPCGENGEFHTVVCDGPGFLSPVPVRVEDITQDDRFIFADVQFETSMQGE
jgi:uncharacterized protein (TIGR00290 family)